MAETAKRIHRKIIVLLLAIIAVCFAVKLQAQSLPLANAFAHNDYQHKKPLFEALNNGYTYIEADVYVYKNRLVVTHVLPSIHHHRTLDSLYLRPLANYAQQHNGKIYPDYSGPVTLMIDIKSDGNKTYALLKPMLEKYRSILSGYQNGQFQQRQLRIVLSGHKPSQVLRQDSDRLAFIDEDLRKVERDSTADENILAMASCKYSKLLKWKGNGLLSTHEKNKLTAYIAEAHRCGAKVRLWSSPDNELVWQQLLNCGVDLINTDKLARLKDFLTKDEETVVRTN